MKRTLHFATAFASLLLAGGAMAQVRYIDEVFTNAQLSITPDVTYGTNIDFLTSDFSNPAVFGPEVVQLQTLVSTQQPIPTPFFDPSDGSTAVKVANLRMDVYQPDQTVDAVTARPLVVYVHTGNALPPPINGSPNGTRKDSTCVEICTRMARRGYVAVSMSYRGGWNPLAATEEERRGQLLNAIYRAIHDVRQCVRTMKADAATYKIDPTKVILMGEGTGGYITLATTTLDDPAELFVPKFRPDPFNPAVSYIDTVKVGNLEGFNGQLTLYRPNGENSDIHFCVNMGGALADTTWLEPGDAPMVAFHTVFDPFAPFNYGIVIVPTTGGPVVDVPGSNYFMPIVNQYGNNDSFATLPDDAWSTVARARYGSTQVHTGSSVAINTGAEGLYPVVTADWPAVNPQFSEEASPWQWWDPNSAIAQSPSPIPGVTVGQASQASNPNFSAAKGRAMIDTIMGYTNPRIVCALDLGPCSLVGLPESDPVSAGVELFPNPATTEVSITSTEADILGFELYDVNGRRVRAENVNARRFTLERNDLPAGAYFLQLTFDRGNVVRKVMLD
ncbi:MAG: T9SS type A sorting domain-containing protein [Flavobacteriales bacterium]|nr:T9SS type A sorting domain-containing protein [Flavobacteriales bacterium]